jgi:predicted DNA-binding transcriptional regulator YafY
MSRSVRLLDLLQVLRRYKRPVQGQKLADELGTSLRTLYRDIAALQAQGAPIVGEAGIGYVLRPGYVVPPLMFTEEELEALVLGSRWVARRADQRLAKAAEGALARISAVLPPGLLENLQDSNLLVGAADGVADNVDIAQVRLAIRRQRKITFGYSDEAGRATQRTVWPFGMGYFDHVRMVMAWCELRQDFRNFRTDRMSGLVVTGERYTRSRRSLLAAWRAAEEIGAEPCTLLT